MAKVNELTEDWYEWVASRPPVVKALCEKYPPNILFRLKSTGQRCTVYSYNEAGTLTVSVTGQYNLIDFSRNVFGIAPEDLEECDLPAEDEEVGETETEEETEQKLALLRAYHQMKREAH